MPAVPGVTPPTVPGTIPPPLPPIDIGNIVVSPPEQPVPQPPPVPALLAPRFISEFRLSSQWTLYWLATLCRASYAPAVDLFARAVQCVLPASYPITFVPNGAGLTPGYAIVKLPQGAIVVVSGTTNLNQWLEQTLNSAPYEFGKLTPPGPNAGVSTIQVYADAARNIWTALMPVVPNDEQILFCGHSMGGAVATLLHGVSDAAPNQRVASRCVSFAAPKPGDQRLATLSRVGSQVYQRLIINNDFIPSLPPNLGLLNIVIPPPLRTPSLGWASFKHAAAPTTVSPIGQLETGSDPLLAVQIGQAILAAANGNPLAPADSHAISEYIARLYGALYPGGAARPTNWTAPDQLTSVNAALTGAGL
jgi:hypothetical protein